MDNESKQSISLLWDLIGGKSQPIQELIDGSHQKCRTDWGISESIIAYHIKAQQREITQLREESAFMKDEIAQLKATLQQTGLLVSYGAMDVGEDEALADDEDEDEDGGAVAHVQHNSTTQSESAVWNLLRGNGPSLQEQIHRSHQKCQANWMMNEAIIATERESLRTEVEQLKKRDDDVKELDQRVESVEEQVVSTDSKLGTQLEYFDKRFASLARLFTNLGKQVAVKTQTEKTQDKRLAELEKSDKVDQVVCSEFMNFAHNLQDALHDLCSGTVVQLAAMSPHKLRIQAKEKLDSFTALELWNVGDRISTRYKTIYGEG